MMWLTMRRTWKKDEHRVLKHNNETTEAIVCVCACVCWGESFLLWKSSLSLGTMWVCAWARYMPVSRWVGVIFSGQ
jgi:hypothetical protein